MYGAASADLHGFRVLLQKTTLLINAIRYKIKENHFILVSKTVNQPASRPVSRPGRQSALTLILTLTLIPGLATGPQRHPGRPRLDYCRLWRRARPLLSPCLALAQSLSPPTPTLPHPRPNPSPPTPTLPRPRPNPKPNPKPRHSHPALPLPLPSLFRLRVRFRPPQAFAQSFHWPQRVCAPALPSLLAPSLSPYRSARGPPPSSGSLAGSSMKVP